MRKLAKADVSPIRQRSQFSCVAASTCMALNAVGIKCNEDQVNEVIGAKPMQGARWEEVLACAQYFGCRAHLTTPATLTQVKSWTDQGKPVLIAWNPEGRDWSHASLVFDVTGEKGNYIVHVADPNIPNPDKTTREVGEDEFYSKWFEKWPNYLVRRPALMIEREVDEGGRQLMASAKNLRTASQSIKDIYGREYSPRRGLEGPFRYKDGRVLYYDRSYKGGTYYDPSTDMYLTHDEAFRITSGYAKSASALASKVATVYLNKKG